MTRQELDAALARLGLDVPEAERDAIAANAHFVEKMAELVKKPRLVGAEPAHTVAFPEK
jgi:hypothetical protein